MANETAKNVLNVLYALTVGLAAATLAVLGPVLVAFVAAWAFQSIGWTRARDAVAKVPAHFVLLVIFGVAVGLTTCLRVLGRQFRNEPEPPRLK